MNLIEKNERMKELIEMLNKYRDAYYNQTESLVSDYEYDCLFDELQRLEEKTGTILSNSPTQTVGYEVKSELRKVKHNHPMLSLNTTKAVSDLVKFQNDKDMVLMCKMDGLTISLRYLNGELISAETRGNCTKRITKILGNKIHLYRICRWVRCTGAGEWIYLRRVFADGRCKILFGLGGKQMQYVVQMEEVDISDGCEAVNVWDLDCSESLARARKLAKGIIRSIKEHALPQLSEISDPTNPVSVSIAQYQSYRNSGKIKLGRILDVLDVETIPSEIWKGELS